MLAAIVLGGCGLSEPMLLSEEKDLQALKAENASPKAWRVELAAVEVLPQEASGDDAWDLEVDARRVQRGLLDALREAGTFAEVSEAGRGEADLALALKVTEARVRYLGGNEHRTLWFLTWLFLTPVAASFIADEQYEGQLDVDVALVEKRGEKRLWGDTLKIAFSAGLDHWQRGISVWDLTLPGPVWAGVDPGRLSDILLPHLRRKLEIELATRLSREVPPPVVDVVLAVGGSGVQGGTSAFSDEDARAVVAKAEQSAGRVQTLLLTGEEASATNLRDTLAGLAGRRDVRFRDLLVYVSGCGTLVEAGKGKGEAALAFGGEDVAFVPVSEILSLVKAIPASSRAVILDAGFAGKKGRAVPSPVASSDRILLDFPDELESIALLSACRPQETTFESKEFQQGIFTHFLLKTWNGDADLDDDGDVSCREAFKSLSWYVQREIRFLGGRSRPFLAGDGVLFRKVETSESR